MNDIALNISFIYDNSRIDDFLRGDYDILFAKESDLNRFSNIQCEFLYQSHFYIITKKDDPLASLDIISENDLNNHVLMVGGGSPKEMVVVQNRIIKNTNVKTMNSPNHETTLLNIAADQGIVLAPGFANDHNNEFAWIPFDCKEHINCVLAYHKDNKSNSVMHFIDLAKEAYKDTKNIPL
ncbi:MAG: LysR substrate-binding domain-containing protein [Erysipelotrichaceae bacterium]|nr:LysR substrate-binding domain-containing protein [Erysipelotrichaceae bacterium]